MVKLGTQQNFCENLKNKVSGKFKKSNFGDLSWFLNIKIERTESKIMLSQEAYIDKIIDKYKMSYCRTMETPLDESSKLSKLDSPEIGSK